MTSAAVTGRTSNVVWCCAGSARCRVCGSWKARDWWIEDGWPFGKVHIVRACWTCKATQTEFVP
jgi:hypothetical protein